jgi:hypothetical protein
MPAKQHAILGVPGLVPNPLPNSTTFVPTGPLVGSTRTDASTFIGIELLTTCLTGAQQDPSGNGSDEAMRITTSPDCTLPGSSTSILSSRHLRTRTVTSPIRPQLLTPKIVFGSRGPAVVPKCSPVQSPESSPVRPQPATPSEWHGLQPRVNASGLHVLLAHDDHVDRAIGRLRRHPHLDEIRPPTVGSSAGTPWKVT